MLNKSIFLIIIGILSLYLAFVGYYRWGDHTPPQITLRKPFSLVGPNTPLSLHIEDSETGLREVSVHIVQNLETFTLVQKQFPTEGPLSSQGGTEHDFDIELVPFADENLPRRRGPATLVVTSRDYSWREFFTGNSERLSQEFSVKFTPPKIEVLSAHDPIPQGGSGLVFYRVSEDADTHGIQVGPALFPGYSTPEGFRKFSLFAIPHNLSPRQTIQIVADDGLGNHVTQDLDYRILPKRWRTRRIKITDRFIEQTVLPIIQQTPVVEDQNDNLKNFLEVNNTLRSINNQQLVEFSKHSKPEFRWRGPFKQLSQSQVEAAFADHRKYFYRGREVDTQDHLGFDLAVTKHYPVEATNYGEVVFSGYLGIYGHTIVLDHGYGLQSLYAHLSAFNVKQGDWIEKGQIIGYTGSTGLAAGDHLHFSLLLHGIQVNPIEWWDPNWVQSRITDRLDLPKELEPMTTPEHLLGPSPSADTRVFP